MKILAISAVSSHPQDAGHRARIFRLFDTFQRQGHEVHFVFLADSSKSTAVQHLTDMRFHWRDGLTVLPFELLANGKRRLDALVDPYSQAWSMDEWYDDRVDIGIKRVISERNPDVVWVEYAYLSKALQNVSDGQVKVIDTNDIFTGRNARLLEVGAAGPEIIPSFREEDEERVAVDRADLIVCIQKSDFDYFSRLSKRVVVEIGHAVACSSPRVRELDSFKVLFVGSQSYVGRRSLMRLVETIMPEVKERLPQVQLNIAGNVCQLLPELPDYCHKLGYVEDLATLYTSNDIAVSAELFATGLSIKNRTALANGMPLVTSPHGARGLREGEGEAFLVCDSDQEFSDTIVEVLSNAELYERLSRQACAFSAVLNDRVEQEVAALLEVLHLRCVSAKTGRSEA